MSLRVAELRSYEDEEWEPTAGAVGLGLYVIAYYVRCDSMLCYIT